MINITVQASYPKDPKIEARLIIDIIANIF